MSTRIKFFRDETPLRATQKLLQSHGIKCYTCTRTPGNTPSGEDPYGFDLYVLRDEDAEDARRILDYEFGTEYGETIRS